MYSAYLIGFHSRSEFSLHEGSVSKNINILGVDMSSSVHIDILILSKGPTQEINDTWLTAETQYSVNFSRSNRTFCLSLHSNGSIRFLFLYAKKIYQAKAKDSEI